MRLLLFGTFLTLVTCVSCRNEMQAENTSPVPGLDLFEQHCKACHGSKGDLGLAGAKDLTRSGLSENLIVSQIMDGKNAMPSFKETLTEGQAAEIAGYVMTLRK